MIGCQLLIAYESTPERKSDRFTYILEGALTEVQGSAPPNAIQEIA